MRRITRSITLREAIIHNLQSGELVILRHVTATSGTTMTSLARVEAHPAVKGQQNLLFGQLIHHAEVWNLCWSPSGDRIATCSEDQTARIWHVVDADRQHCTPILEHVLRGHTLAVTAVDWQRREDGTELLVTCSDDRTVRLYHVADMTLMRQLSTAHLHGWHTLTYMALNALASRLVCVTQHGYFVAWQLDSSEAETTLLVAARVHAGSVEGLHWMETGNRAVVATVAADGSVLLIRLRV